jgi:hypothetical protein
MEKYIWPLIFPSLFYRPHLVSRTSHNIDLIFGSKFTEILETDFPQFNEAKSK